MKKYWNSKNELTIFLLHRKLPFLKLQGSKWRKYRQKTKISIPEVVGQTHRHNHSMEGENVVVGVEVHDVGEWKAYGHVQCVVRMIDGAYFGFMTV